MFIEILIRILFGIIYIILELKVPPFKRIIQPEDWHYYLYPHKPDTVEVWWLGVLAVAVPGISMIAASFQNSNYYNRKKLNARKRSFILWDIYDVFMAYTLSCCVWSFDKCGQTFVR